MTHRTATLCVLLFIIAAHSLARRAAEVDCYKAVFNHYPKNVPSDRSVDAPLTGNGDIGLTAAARKGELNLYFGKNDFWKAVEDYTYGRIAQPGGLRMTGDILKGEYHAEQLPGSAEVRMTFRLDAEQLTICMWVAAKENMVVVEFESTCSTDLCLDLWACQGDGSTTESGSENGCAWVHRSFQDIPHLQWPSHIAIAMNREQGTMHLQKGEHRTIVCTLYTDKDTPKWHATALRKTARVSDASLRQTKAEHKAWWEEFWGLSDVSLGDSLLEQYYYQSQYIFACASRKGKYAPGLWGPFITSDKPAWSGDYHLNYNFEAPYWAQYTSNHISLTENYEEPMLAYMEQGRRHAWNLCRCRGILYPVGLGPNGLVTQAWHRNSLGQPSDLEDGCMFWKQRTNASFVAANMMMRFHCTFDKAYARRVYPFILACADFWEDYLTFIDGRYVVFGDVFNETDPRNSSAAGDFNCLMSLGMARMILLGAKELSTFLGKDKVRWKKWDDILQHLSAFPLGHDEEGNFSLDYCERTGVKPSGISRLHMHAVLIPTGLTGPNLTPEYNKIMLSDLKKWQSTDQQDWGQSLGNGVETVYPGAARIGYPAAQLLAHLKERIHRGASPNCYVHAGGGGLETLSAVPGTINEMLLQSYEGILRIFPNWETSRNASFNNLRAYGAFLVSSSINNGQTGPVNILSEKGRTCVMENPWPNQQVRLVRNGKNAESLQGTTLHFRTKPGEKILISHQ